MKRVIIAILVLVCSVVMFSGCWSEGERYSNTEVAKLYEKTNSKDTYNISYNLKKSLKYWYDDDSSLLAMDKYFGIDGATLKRTKESDGKTKYDYKGSYVQKDSRDAPTKTYGFKVYNDTTYMYKTVEGSEKYKKELNQSDYEKETINMLNYGFASNSNIDRAYKYTNSNGGVKYFIEYYLHNEDMDTYPCWTMFSSAYQGSPSSPDFTISHSEGSLYEKIKMELWVEFNADGLITKQNAVLNFKITGKRIDNRECHGEAKLEINIDYRW